MTRYVLFTYTTKKNTQEEKKTFPKGLRDKHVLFTLLSSKVEITNSQEAL